jgi:hypothetical protein
VRRAESGGGPKEGFLERARKAEDAAAAWDGMFDTCCVVWRPFFVFCYCSLPSSPLDVWNK